MSFSPTVPMLDLANTPIDDAVRIFGEGLETFGFVVVTDHGVPQELLDEAYDSMRRVFALSDEEKATYSRPEHKLQVGYAPFGSEHAKDDPKPDLKEFWQVLRPGYAVANVFPSEVPEFGACMTDLYLALDALSVRLMGLLGRHLRLPVTHFPDMMAGGRSVMRPIHYPRISLRELGMRSAPHEDINLITLLVAATASGLEIKTRDGLWLPVTNPPGAIIVNSGDMLALHTDGRIPSTTHQVTNGDGGERYSIPFFGHPRPDALLRTDPPLTAEEALEARLAEIGFKA